MKAIVVTARKSENSGMWGHLGICERKQDAGGGKVFSPLKRTHSQPCLRQSAMLPRTIFRLRFRHPTCNGQRYACAIWPCADNIYGM